MPDMGSDIIGNATVVESLMRIARSPNLGHAYLFFGPDGVGKRLASLAFAKAVNCRCEEDSGRCDSCRLMDRLSHPELLLLEDANKPKWLRRAEIVEAMGGGEDGRRRYEAVVRNLFEKRYLEEPLPRTSEDRAVDGFSIVTNHLFGRGSVPSKECYTPKQITESIRKRYDREDLSEAEYLLLRRLFEYPLSVMPYRGAIPIAYVTPRRGWGFTRPIQIFLSMRTMLDGKKIVIIDDAHKMTPEAQNCLLKTLEEPPADSMIILITSDKQLLFQTIVSRCQIVSFARLTTAEVEAAARRLLGGSNEHVGLMATLSENCPGRLLELSAIDLDSRLRRVSDFFTGVGHGRLETVFAFSRGVLEGGGSHRRKLRQTVREGLELLLFWMVEILRLKQGLPDRMGVSVYTDALKAHAQRFSETSLIDATRHLEKSFALIGLNVDMTLLLQATLFRTALALQCPGEQGNTRPAAVLSP